VDEEKLKRLRWPALGACLLKILLRLFMMTLVVVVRGKRRGVDCCDKGGVVVMAAALSQDVLPNDVGFFLNKKRRW
jgi:hypothetical protein